MLRSQGLWTGTCEVCGLPRHPLAQLCRRCKNLRDRPDTRKDADGNRWVVDKQARQEAMRSQWDGRIGAFRCKYTGLPLTTDAPNGVAGPLFATWEHRDPRSPTKASEVVLVGWLINDMKNDLDEREFKKMVKALAAHFGDPSAPFNRRALPRGWHRRRS